MTVVTAIVVVGAVFYLSSLVVVGSLSWRQGAAARPVPSWPSWTLEDHAPARVLGRGKGRVLWLGWCYWCGVALTTPVAENEPWTSWGTLGRRCAVALDGKWYCQACATAVREVIEVAK